MNKVWAVTSYFNPLGWRSRLTNYRFFRKHLEVPLVTVEWHPSGEFQLDSGDADLLVQIKGGDLMWQKERLLNKGLESIPSEAEFIAWIDCDIVFCHPGWPQAAVQTLAEQKAVQLFSKAHYLNHTETRSLLDSSGRRSDLVRQPPKGGAVTRSSGSLIGQKGASAFDGFHEGNPGLAWAARNSTITEVGFFDRIIIGSGDFFWLLAAMGLAESWLADRRHLGNYDYLAGSSYLAWAVEVEALIGKQIGFLETPILHLHHGGIADRGYIERDASFSREGIDIDRDITLSADGVWEFVTPNPSWKSWMNQYFLDRREDET
jgi:hypothetical protein